MYILVHIILLYFTWECKSVFFLNSLIFHSAGRSPYRLEDLEPGEHRIKIYPACVSPDQRSYRVTARFTVQ